MSDAADPPPILLPPVAPQWPALPPPSVWRRTFRLKLSIAIPVIIASLTIVTALCEAYFISRILKEGLLGTPDYRRLLAILAMVNRIFYLSVAASTLVAIAISHAVIQPIQRLVRYAKTLATGNLTSRIAVRSSDEFGILEMAFNEMAAALKAYQNQSEEYSRTLEERVAARTAEMSTALRLSKSMLHIVDQDRLLKLLASGLHDVTRYDLCAIALVTEEGLEIFLRSMGRLHPALSQALVRRIRGEIAALAGTPPVADDRVQVTVSEEVEGVVGSRTATDALDSFLIAPLMVGTSVTGAIALGSLQPGCFNEHLAKLLTVVANHAALGVENTKGYARLKALDRVKSDFISTVSHELRTPLTVVKEGLDLMSETPMGTLNARQQEFLAVIRENAHRLYVLINDLLDLSKLEAGKARLRKQPLLLQQAAAESLRRFAIQAEQKRLQCAAEVPQDLPAVYADGDKVAQVFANLISNAVKYGAPEGRIRITARLVDDLVETCVWNTGAPLPPAELERIFEKFYQVGRTPGPGLQGTGLGLTIVREIIQHHDGSVWARSDPTGNSFLFTLPLFRRQTYLRDCLADLIDQAKLHHAFCCLVQIRWENAALWQARAGAARVEELLQAMEQAARNALEQRGLADRVLRFGEEPALALLATTTAEEADALAAKAIETLQQPTLAPRAPEMPPPRWSSRMAVYPRDGATAADLLKRVSPAA